MNIRTKKKAAEIAWFSALCSDDYHFLGVPEGHLRSSFEHCKSIVQKADHKGFQNILLPSSYQVGQDTLTFAAAMAEQTRQIQLLAAIRCGEVHPPMLARTISTLDHMLKGRLTLNIISSDLPGTRLDSTSRYRRSSEVIQILKQAWTQDHIDFRGDFYQIELPSDPVKPYQQQGGPLLYFGGYSEAARELCAQFCDVYLLWPDKEQGLIQSMQKVVGRAETHGRTIDFGLRIHVIVRETEAEARSAAQHLVSRLDPDKGNAIKHRAQDSKSAGVLTQDELRSQADEEGYIESSLWTGIGRARSGCASAIVGNPDQVRDKLERYIDMGFRSFVLSGYPHLDECDLFAKYVLPDLKTCRLPEVQQRVPTETPATPLTHGPRS
ncbi:MAG: LLM class flavin-dependent oxidoreductase [Limisphaerales bacterium]|tara:strand:- start:3953 stop:5095 length:1143 start_codon:yes stop_codon:yes gene_type:complete